MHTPVTEDQFEISDAGIKHVPTGCEFTPYPGSPYDGTRREGIEAASSRTAAIIKWKSWTP